MFVNKTAGAEHFWQRGRLAPLIRKCSQHVVGSDLAMAEKGRRDLSPLALPDLQQSFLPMVRLLPHAAPDRSGGKHPLSGLTER